MLWCLCNICLNTVKITIRQQVVCGTIIEMNQRNPLSSNFFLFLFFILFFYFYLFLFIYLFIFWDLLFQIPFSNLSRNKGIKILHQNIRELFNKIPDIQITLYEFNLHVLTLFETHINSNNYNDADSLCNIPGYDFFKKNRIKGPDGGVAMFISNTLKWNRWVRK